MNIRRTDIELIEQAAAGGWMRQLAFFHLLKFKFNNSCIFNYKKRMQEIAGMFNISTKTLYNYLNFLKAKGLAWNHCNNLVLASLKTGLKKTTLVINEENLNISDISVLLYGKLVERQARKISFMESLRRWKRGERITGITTGTPFRPSISYRNIAKVINASEFKAYEIVKKLNELKVIKTEKQNPVKLGNGNKGSIKFLKDLPGYHFNFKETIYQLFGSKHNFLIQPVYLRRISLKTFKKYYAFIGC